MRFRWTRAWLGMCASGLLGANSPFHAPLRSPFPHPASAAMLRPPTCPLPPKPSPRLDIIGAYVVTDASYSKIDPARASARAASIAPVNAFTGGAVLMANRYLRSRGKDVASGMCALQWLSAWAGAGAMTQMPDHEAQFVRSVNLAAWAMAYAQVRGIRFSQNDPHPIVTDWLARMAADMRSHTSALTNTTAYNNHRYWAGFAAMAVAMDTGDRSLMNWALGSARIGLDQIDAAGVLPHELARKSRARHYHLYAAMPLVMTAEIAAANGVDLYGYRNGALHLLVGFALGSPAAMAQKAGSIQDPMTLATRRYDNQRIAWIELYNRRFRGRAAPIAGLLVNRPLVNNEIGGDMTLLASGVAP